MARRVSRSGRLDVGDQAHDEPAAEPVLEGGDGVRGPVRGQHDLAVGLVEGVEGVEELLLEALLALEEVDVVHEQDVDLAVAALELGGGVVPDGVDVLVEEQLGAHVADHEGRVVLLDVVADGVQQVGLAQPAGPVDGQRVVGAGRRLGHAERRGVGELVGAADDEGLEGLLGADVGGAGRDGELAVEAVGGHGQLVEQGELVEGVGVLLVEPGGVGQVEEVGLHGVGVDHDEAQVGDLRGVLGQGVVDQGPVALVEALTGHHAGHPEHQGRALDLQGLGGLEVHEEDAAGDLLFQVGPATFPEVVCVCVGHQTTAPQPNPVVRDVKGRPQAVDAPVENSEQGRSSLTESSWPPLPFSMSPSGPTRSAPGRSRLRSAQGGEPSTALRVLRDEHVLPGQGAIPPISFVDLSTG